MAYQTGTATDYKDLLSKLKDFITTPNTLGAVTPGSNTGNGSHGTANLGGGGGSCASTFTAGNGGSGYVVIVTG